MRLMMSIFGDENFTSLRMSVKFLEHVVTEDGVETDPEKLR